VTEQACDPSVSLRELSSYETIRPRLYILSDIRLLCEGIALALAQHPSVLVVGSSDLATEPTQIAGLRPDVLLLDIATPGGLGIAGPVRQILPDVKTVAIAVSDVEQEVITCAEAGVSGFVSRNGSAQDVVTAVHCAVRGELVCSPRTAALMFNRIAVLAAKQHGSANGHTLTRREHEIVSLLNEGLSNKEIARRLRIQNATVKNHVHSILGKMDVRRRGEVAWQFRRDHLRRSGSATLSGNAGAGMDLVGHSPSD
jgi:two-component system nitrate/nitrite response regulator NarL